jgi:hypothetical protein
MCTRSGLYRTNDAFTLPFQVTSFTPSELVAVDKVLNPLYHYQFQARTLVQVSTPAVAVKIRIKKVEVRIFIFLHRYLMKNNTFLKFLAKPLTCSTRQNYIFLQNIPVPACVGISCSSS